MSTVSLRRLAVADKGLALYSCQKEIEVQRLHFAYCWYILLCLAGLKAGRAVDVALWSAGRNTLATEAIMIYSREFKGRSQEIGKFTE
jgi:hypothetical protein